MSMFGMRERCPRIKMRLEDITKRCPGLNPGELYYLEISEVSRN